MEAISCKNNRNMIFYELILIDGAKIFIGALDYIYPYINTHI